MLWDPYIYRPNTCSYIIIMALLRLFSSSVITPKSILPFKSKLFYFTRLWCLKYWVSVMLCLVKKITLTRHFNVPNTNRNYLNSIASTAFNLKPLNITLLYQHDWNQHAYNGLHWGRAVFLLTRGYTSSLYHPNQTSIHFLHTFMQY